MRLLIHPGAPKTGTSTIQAFLHGNRAALAARGVAVLTPFEIRRTPLEAALRGGARRGAARAAASLDDLARRADGAETLILSDEALTREMMPGFSARPVGFDAAARAAKYLAALPFARIEAVLTIRAQPGFLASVYAHRVKLHGERRSFGVWLSEAVAADRLSWAAVIDAFEARLGAGRLRVLPFEIARAEGTEAYLRAAAAAFGLEPEGLNFGTPAKNVSASGVAVSLSRLANRAASPRGGRSPLPVRLARWLPSDRWGGFRPRDPRLDEIAATYAAENAALAARHFPERAALYAPGG